MEFMCTNEYRKISLQKVDEIIYRYCNHYRNEKWLERTNKMFRPKKDKRHLNLLERYIGNKSNLGKNIIVIGSAGSGKCHHPWDSLKPCPCGCMERPLLMYTKDELYYCGGPRENVFAICSVCGRHTEKSDIATTINNWNDDKTKDANVCESLEIVFDKEEELKYLSDIRGYMCRKI